MSSDGDDDMYLRRGAGSNGISTATSQPLSSFTMHHLYKSPPARPQLPQQEPTRAEIAFDYDDVLDPGPTVVSEEDTTYELDYLDDLVVDATTTTTTSRPRTTTSKNALLSMLKVTDRTDASRACTTFIPDAPPIWHPSTHGL